MKHGLGALVLCLCCAAGCSREDTAPGRTAERGEVRNEEGRGIAPSSSLRATHELIDRAEADDPTAALQAIESAFEQLADSGTELLAKQDLAFRAAEISLSTGAARDARSWAERGLELSDEPSAPRANLLVVLADAERALGRPQRERAALMEALQLNQVLLEKELEHP